MRVDRLVCTLAGAVLLIGGSYADTANNSFASVSGNGVVADGESGFCIKNVEGTVEITVNERPGWKCEKGAPYGYAHNEGDVDNIRFDGLDDEETATISISNVWECVHETTNIDYHVSSPGAEDKGPFHMIAAYSSPASKGAALSFDRSIVLEGRVGHHTNIVIALRCPNPKCDYGIKNPIEESDIVVDPSPVVASADMPEGGILQADGRIVYPQGTHKVCYKADFSNNCAKCGFHKEVVRTIDVYQATSMADEYVGLDRTDAGYAKEHTMSGSVTLKAIPPHVAFNWNVWPHCKIKDNNDGESVVCIVKRIAGDVPGGKDFEYSSRYRQERLSCGINIWDDCTPNCKADTSTTNNFTVVKVDVTIDDVPETIEEAEGAFTYYVPCSDAPIWAEEWTNSLKDVSITCEPHDGEMSNQIVRLKFPEGHLYAKNKDGVYVEAKTEYTVEELNKTKFKIHGHKKSGSYKDKEIVAEHEVSHAIDKASFTVFGRPLLVPDYNRTNGIEKVDYDKAKGGIIPFRFWINDDDDNGDSWAGTEDLLPIIYSNGAINKNSNNQPGRGENWSDDKINGYSDVVDFAAMLVDVSDVFPADTPETITKCMDWRFQSSCVNMVFTGLEVEMAKTFQTEDHNRYGKNFEQHIYEAEVVNIPDLHPAPPCFQTLLDEKRKGIVLLEGKARGWYLGILGRTNSGREICKGAVNISVSPVENMYRWLDLRSAGKELLGESHAACNSADTLCNGMSEPINNPDSNCNGDPRDGRHIVFVHGYNINAREATAWGAEMFKRLWQSGSTSLFTVVDWVGDAGQFGDPDDGKSVSYYYAVPNAFLAAEKLQKAVNDTKFKGEPVLMAHSLGNVVVSSAIVDWEMRCSKYYLLNAAVAIQAYEDRRDNLMIEDNWLPIREKYYASYWYKNFTEANGYDNDFRGKLFWCGRFGKINQAVNYFSPSDDVVHDIEANSLGVYTSHSAWTLQERMKGRVAMRIADRFTSLYTAITGSDNPKFLGTEAGWGFNKSRVGIIGNVLQPSTDINSVPFKELIKEPIFYPFKSMSERMNSTAVFEYKKSDHDQYVLRAKLLGSAIPATCFATGANVLEETQSFPYQNYINTKWPRRNRNWFHSDLKNVAYFFNSEFFNNVVSD